MKPLSGDLNMSWFPCKLEHCQHCGSDDFDVGVCEPRTLLICECCQYAAAHIQCEEKISGFKLSPETLSSGHTWYCSKVRSSQIKVYHCTALPADWAR